ncbi:hypothetical protein [Kribbella jiaozuonensis]|uniref:Uncharacterized protein n=1 Tax=Kribbella jiaozuonensis TaxID=2575441 RepID=A0A4U3LNM5_9ACTN|nr:hypothetical protein [Kribbella jiaozuonensis]TKK76096.1 hypothetical protein FDA38_27115 [Kribbella jiaozuonensis]
MGQRPDRPTLVAAATRPRSRPSNPHAQRKSDGRPTGPRTRSLDDPEPLEIVAPSSIAVEPHDLDAIAAEIANETFAEFGAGLTIESVATYLEVLDAATKAGILEPKLHQIAVNALVNHLTDDDPRWSLPDYVNQAA